MKKSITSVIVLLAGAFVVHCQGTLSFGNYGQLSSYIYVSLGSTKLGGGALEPLPVPPAAETGSGYYWTVALYGAAGWGDPASSLVQLETANGQPVTATLEDGTSDTVAGTWYSTAVAQVPGTTSADRDATVQLYGWYNAGGTINYALAQLSGYPTGFSTTANVTVGGDAVDGGGPLAPGYLPSGLSFSLSTNTVSEPTSIALGVMGASAFLLRFAQKAK